MAIAARPTQETWVATNKWRLWRLINSAVILFGFYMPWAVMDTYQHVVYTGLQWFQFLMSFAIPTWFPEMGWSEHIRISAGTLHLLLGVITILTYAALNALAAVFTTRFTASWVWKPLMVCLLAFAAMSLWFTLLLGDLQDLPLWGYWLTLAGFASSVLLEILSFLLKRT